MNKLKAWAKLAQTSLRRVPTDFWRILILFIITRLLLTAIGYAAWRFFGSIDPASYNTKWTFNGDASRLLYHHPILAIWGHWDTGWYLKIAHDWYKYQPFSTGRYGLVFFPLYPVLIRLTSHITGSYFLNGLLISNSALIVSCWYLYRFCSERWDREIALRAAKFMLIFPTTFYLSSVLSEPLFVMSSIIAMYYAYNKRWALCGIFGGLIALSRPIGVLLLIPLLVLYQRQHRNRSWQEHLGRLRHLAWAPLGFLAFIILQWHLAGDWFIDSKLERAGWDRHLTSPLTLLHQAGANFTNHFLLLMGLLPFLLIFLARKKLDLVIILWAIVLMLPALATSLVGLPRYATAVIPVYISLAVLTHRSSIDQVVTITCAMLAGVLMLLWAIGAPFLQ